LGFGLDILPCNSRLKAVGLSCFATFLNSDSLAERYPGPFGLLLGHVEDDLSTGRGLEVTESALLQHFFR
jgi:hypothetical protein